MSEFKMAINEKAYLLLLLKNPKKALSTNGIKVNKKKLKELETLANSEIERWKTLASSRISGIPKFEKALNDKEFLNLLLKNPKQALSVNGIKVRKIQLETLEKLARSELEHWKNDLLAWNKTRITKTPDVYVNVEAIVIDKRCHVLT